MRYGVSVSCLADESDDPGAVCSVSHTGQLILSFWISFAKQSAQYECRQTSSKGLFKFFWQ